MVATMRTATGALVAIVGETAIEIEIVDGFRLRRAREPRGQTGRRRLRLRRWDGNGVPARTPTGAT